METLTLDATVRDLKMKPKALRGSGQIPAEFYGAGQKNMSLMMPYQIFKKCYDKAGENTVVQLMVNGKAHPVLVHDIDLDPVSDMITHVDFIHVDMNKEVSTSVKITFVGVAPAVKSLGGNLDIQKHELKIRCLPKDLIHSVEVDVSSIVDFHTSIHVKDIAVPANIKVLDNADDTVVTASAMKVEVESAPVSPADVGIAGAPPADAEGAEAHAATAAPEAKEKK